jgi:GNAT superfamily N-acetyltransferase
LIPPPEGAGMPRLTLEIQDQERTGARDVAIRPAVDDDAERIRDLVRAAYTKWVPVIGREPAPMQADYRRAVRQHRIDILDVDGAMAGVLECIVRDDHLWIENVAVTPERHGQGLGRGLLAHAEHLAARSGLGEIRLLTNGAFEANITLYRAIGYTIDQTEPFKGGTTFYMSKRIVGQAMGPVA